MNWGKSSSASSPSSRLKTDAFDRMNSDDFQARLLETFQVEAREHLDAITAGLLELEKGMSRTGNEVD